jgi:hypothetical protein
MNAYVVNSAIALIEVMVLNSIRCMEASTNIVSIGIITTDTITASLGTCRGSYGFVSLLCWLGIHRQGMYRQIRLSLS